MTTTEQKENLLERAHIVAIETEASANDANRIGTLFGDIINGMGDGLTENDEDDYTDAHTLRTDKSQNLTSAEKARALQNLGIPGIATGGDFDNPTPTQRAKVPTVGAILDTGVMEGYVYDVTAMNSGTTFASLEALLSSEHLNDYIPVAKRKGGMSIKFVLSFDNKYVKFFCTADDFTTDVTKWQGVDDEPIAGSDNVVKSGGVYQEIFKTNNLLFPLRDVIKTVESDKFYICDAEGNVILEVNNEGVNAPNIAAIEENVSRFFTSVFTDYYENEFYITDSDGNVVLRVNKDGLETLGLRNRLSGFTLYSLGDSLSTGGIWQNVVKYYLNIAFDNAKNIKGDSPLSVGGTKSFGDGFDTMLWRAKNLIDNRYINDSGETSIVVLECVNDFVDAPSDYTFDESEITIVPTDPIEGYLYQNWGVDLLNSIPSDDRKLNAVFRLLIENQSGKNLSIVTLPQREGDFKLVIHTSGGGDNVYYIHVVPQETEEATLAYVLNKILEYNYSTVTDSLAADGESVDFVGSSLSMSWQDVGDTGIVLSIQDTSSARTSTAKYFVGESISDWTDLTKWISGSDINLSMAYKSVIEMLLKEYPKLNLFIGIFPIHATTPSSYLLPNGNYDTYTYSLSDRMVRNKHFAEVLSEIADYYHIKTINVFNECGITITNYSTYYNNNNVHPKDVGYERFGEVVSAGIKKYLI